MGKAMSHQGMNVKNLRRSNKSLILYLLNKQGDMSRKELALRTGLTPAAVTKLCAELIEGGYIRECGVADNKHGGRPEILLTLRLCERNVLAVNAERNRVTFSVCDMAGGLKCTSAINFTTDVDEVVRAAKSFLFESGERVQAIGVCIIGSPDDAEYRVWQCDDLAAKFTHEFGVTAVVDNNVRAFAEAELLYGDIRDSKSVLFFKWGPGVGSSIVANGRVFSGNDSGVAEIGHYIVRGDGQRCRCGRYGCLETEVSEEAILQMAKTKGLHMGLAELAVSDERAAMDVVDDRLSLIAPALLNTATILNANEVVLFGTMFSRERTRNKLAELIGGYYTGSAPLAISRLNDKRNHIGAVAICAEKLFFNAQ